MNKKPTNRLDILDRTLRKLGLMRISRAKHITVEIHATYQRQITRWVQEDFHVPPKPGFEAEAREWAATAFDQANAAITQERHLLLTDEEKDELFRDTQKLDAFLERHGYS
jgi:hypothetical protein